MVDHIHQIVITDHHYRTVIDIMATCNHPPSVIDANTNTNTKKNQGNHNQQPLPPSLEPPRLPPPQTNNTQFDGDHDDCRYQKHQQHITNVSRPLLETTHYHRRHHPDLNTPCHTATATTNNTPTPKLTNITNVPVVDMTTASNHHSHHDHNHHHHQTRPTIHQVPTSPTLPTEKPPDCCSQQCNGDVNRSMLTAAISTNQYSHNSDREAIVRVNQRKKQQDQQRHYSLGRHYTSR